MGAPSGAAVHEGTEPAVRPTRARRQEGETEEAQRRRMAGILHDVRQGRVEVRTDGKKALSPGRRDDVMP